MLKLKLSHKNIYMVVILILFACTLSFCINKSSTMAATLARPQSLKINITDDSIKLKWKSVKNADKYEVYRSKSKKGKYKKIKTVSKCSCIIEQESGRKFFYKVRAYKINSGKNDKKRFGSYSIVKSAIIPQNTEERSPTEQLIIPENVSIYSSMQTEYSAIFVKVDNISDSVLTVSSETSRTIYTLKKPENISVQIGMRFKICTPQITKDLEIMSYSNIIVLGEGNWTQKPYYVKEISDDVLYLALSADEEVIVTFNTSLNEVVVTKNNQNISVKDIKVGDSLFFYISTPIATSMPGVIVDCTQINIVN